MADDVGGSDAHADEPRRRPGRTLTASRRSPARHCQSPRTPEHRADQPSAAQVQQRAGGVRWRRREIATAVQRPAPRRRSGSWSGPSRMPVVRTSAVSKSSRRIECHRARAPERSNRAPRGDPGCAGGRRSWITSHGPWGKRSPTRSSRRPPGGSSSSDDRARVRIHRRRAARRADTLPRTRRRAIEPASRTDLPGSAPAAHQGAQGRNRRVVERLLQAAEAVSRGLRLGVGKQVSDSLMASLGDGLPGPEQARSAKGIVVEAGGNSTSAMPATDVGDSTRISSSVNPSWRVASAVCWPSSGGEQHHSGGGAAEVDHVADRAPCRVRHLDIDEVREFGCDPVGRATSSASMSCTRS